MRCTHGGRETCKRRVPRTALHGFTRDARALRRLPVCLEAASKAVLTCSLLKNGGTGRDEPAHGDCAPSLVYSVMKSPGTGCADSPVSGTCISAV